MRTVKWPLAVGVCVLGLAAGCGTGDDTGGGTPSSGANTGSAQHGAPMVKGKKGMNPPPPPPPPPPHG
jgi:hypothetical protein